MSIRVRARKKDKTATPLVQALAALVFILTLCCIGISTYATLLETPKDVLQGRTRFYSAQESFYTNQKYWTAKRHQLEQKMALAIEEEDRATLAHLVHDITPEMIISYVVDELNIPMQTTNTISYTPKISGSTLYILLSKKAKALWPFSIILSLEMEVKLSKQGATLTYHRLRRGSQEIPPSQALAYFGSNLKSLHSTDSIALASDPFIKNNPKIEK